MLNIINAFLQLNIFFNGSGLDQNVLFLAYFCFLNFRLVNQSVKNVY